MFYFIFQRGVCTTFSRRFLQRLVLTDLQLTFLPAAAPNVSFVSKFVHLRMEIKYVFWMHGWTVAFILAVGIVDNCIDFGSQGGKSDDGIVGTSGRLPVLNTHTNQANGADRSWRISHAASRPFSQDAVRSSKHELRFLLKRFLLRLARALLLTGCFFYLLSQNEWNIYRECPL